MERFEPFPESEPRWCCWLGPTSTRRATHPARLVLIAVTLTPRELLAARLAAEGLRNRDIAERLECGVRTVESHIAQARAKLGAATREDLARLLPRVDPI